MTARFGDGLWPFPKVTAKVRKASNSLSAKLKKRPNFRVGCTPRGNKVSWCHFLEKSLLNQNMLVAGQKKCPKAVATTLKVTHPQFGQNKILLCLFQT